MVGLDVQNLAVELDGSVHVVQVLLVQLGNAILKAHRLRRVRRQLCFVLKDTEQLLPVARSLEQHVQPSERGQVIRIQLQDLLVGVDGPIDVGQLALVDRPDLIEDELLLFGIGDEIRPLRVHGEQLFPTRQAEVQLDERVDAAQVFAVNLEDLEVNGDGLLLSLQNLFFDLGGLIERLLLLIHVFEDLCLALQDERHVGVALGGLEKSLERLRRLEISRIDAQHPPVQLDRPIYVSDFELEDASRGAVQLGADLRILLLPRQLLEHPR